MEMGLSYDAMNALNPMVDMDEVKSGMTQKTAMGHGELLPPHHQTIHVNTKFNMCEANTVLLP